MQQQLKIITKRFKQNEYSSIHVIKENQSLQSSNLEDPASLNQETEDLKEQIRMIQGSLETVVSDGNRLIQFYEESFQQMAINNENLKEELGESKRLLNDQRMETQRTLGESNEKIQNLNKEIAQKQESYRELLEKYDEIVERVDQIHQQEENQVKEIEDLVKESRNYKQYMKQSDKKFEAVNLLLGQITEKNEALTNENNLLKDQIERLTQDIQFNKLRQEAQKFDRFIHFQNRQDISLLEQVEKCEIQSFNPHNTSRQYVRAIFQQIKVSESPDLYLNGFSEEKELLNISEHYSKFNGTQQMRPSKKRQSYQFNQPRNGKKYQLTTIPEVKIDIICSRIEDKTMTERINQTAVTLNTTPIQDPYRSFFLLLIQCQKLNSPHFQKISHININYLYYDVKKRAIPFNKWQEEIRKALESKIPKKNRTK